MFFFKMSFMALTGASKFVNPVKDYSKHVGIVVLGQTPRPDVEALYNDYAPGLDPSIRGALDGLDDKAVRDLANGSQDYLLWVVLAGGRTCEIGRDRLIPLIEKKIVELSREEARFVVLMCSGDFPDFKVPIPVILPNRLVSTMALLFSHRKKIGIVIPNEGQVGSAVAGWKAKGFEVKAVVAAPNDKTALNNAAETLKDCNLDLVIMDCMGFGPKDSDKIMRISNHNTICPKTLVARVAAEMAGV